MLISFHAKQNSVPQSREKYMGRWIALEGVITDEVYVQGVKKKKVMNRNVSRIRQLAG